MEIKVLGSGCKNCKKLLENVNIACEALDVKADIHYVTDMIEIAKSGLMSTPGLIINQKIVDNGKVLDVKEIKRPVPK